MVWVSAVSTPALNRAALITSRTPETMYVPEIITFRPTVSNSLPMISGPVAYSDKFAGRLSRP
jgi:hypothetical protein